MAQVAELESQVMIQRLPLGTLPCHLNSYFYYPCFLKSCPICSLNQRERSLEKFRQDPNEQLILAIIGAGGVGIDLTSATKVYLMVSQPDEIWENCLRTHMESKKLQDPCWNLSVESQAADRAYFLGQPCLTHIICYFVEVSIEVNMMEVHLIEYYPDLRVLKQFIVQRLYKQTHRYKKGSKKAFFYLQIFWSRLVINQSDPTA
ncbi:uncharacterized protein VP01_1748g8 [Puccinia sorghi]|uniref:Helicase C-terminal domain-containing protein n=1 Tax=Puccinia sorghi TaxID=27349 RepID=A0A0L6VH01_9BASI|nr:uncharacterized protein VP01_1748g8 [Puccinia sorghi]